MDNPFDLAYADSGDGGIAVSDQAPAFFQPPQQQNPFDVAEVQDAARFVTTPEDKVRFDRFAADKLAPPLPVRSPMEDILPSIGKGVHQVGQALVAGLGDIGSVATGQNEDFTFDRAGNVIPKPHEQSNIEALRAGEPLPAVEQLKNLSTPERVVARASQGLAETVPQMVLVGGAQALGIPAPIAAAAVFGTTSEGFVPEQAAIAFALPFVGKYGGQLSELVAKKTGVASDAALDFINGVGSTVAAGALLSAIQAHEIANLPPDQRKDAIIEAVAGVVGQSMLGPMGKTRLPGAGNKTTGEPSANRIETPVEVGSGEPARPPAQVAERISGEIQQPSATQTEVQSASGDVAAQVAQEKDSVVHAKRLIGADELKRRAKAMAELDPYLQDVKGVGQKEMWALEFAAQRTIQGRWVEPKPTAPLATPSTEPRTATATEQPTNIPVSGEPNAPPPPVTPPELLTPKQFGLDIYGSPTEHLQSAFSERRPVNADLFHQQVDEATKREPALTLPNGYVREGGRYVYKPTESAPVTETPVLGGAEANLPDQQREQSRRNNEAQAAQMRAELEAMGVKVPENPAPQTKSAPVSNELAVETLAPSPAKPLHELTNQEWQDQRHMLRQLMASTNKPDVKAWAESELSKFARTHEEQVRLASPAPVAEPEPKPAVPPPPPKKPTQAPPVAPVEEKAAPISGTWRETLRQEYDKRVKRGMPPERAMKAAAEETELIDPTSPELFTSTPGVGIDAAKLATQLAEADFAKGKWFKPSQRSAYFKPGATSLLNETGATWHDDGIIDVQHVSQQFLYELSKSDSAQVLETMGEDAGLKWLAEASKFNYPERTIRPEVKTVIEGQSGVLDTAITKIEDLQKRLQSGFNKGDTALGIPVAILNTALDIAKLALKAGKTVAEAINAAVAKIREHIATFDEKEVRDTLNGELATEPSGTTESTTVDPATGQRVSDAEGGNDIVNIAGQEFSIMGKDRMTPEQKAAAASRVQTYFRSELGLPGEPDNSVGTRRGSTDTNVVFKIQPDGENHDAAGEKLLAHLTEQIQMQHQPGGNPAYVSMLVNAINKNFNTGDLGRVLSPGMLDRLMNISVGESSWRGSMLRAITGITEDMVTVARNPMFFLRRTYENMFGGDLVRKIMDRIANNFGESFTGEEIERLYNANPKLQELFNKVVDRLKVKPSLKEVIQEIFATRVDKQDDIVQKFVDTMVNKFSATPEEAAKLKTEFGNTFVKSFEAARLKAQAKALATLLPEERKVIGPGTPLWKKLTDLVNSGWFNSAKVVEEYARSKGMVIPTPAEVERMRQWSIKEQSLKEPTLEEIASSDADEAKAAAKVSAVTLETRQDLLRKMNTQWSRWTHPLARNPKEYLTNPEMRYNSVMAGNEWLTANLLLKIGFGSRQLFDVGTQMVLHTPTRAAQYAFEQWENDKSAGRDTNLLDNLSQTITDAYRTRLKVLGDTLASFRRTLSGRGEQKNVEQLLSSIAVFDRALLTADEMKAAGKPAAARFLHLLALTLRFGRQFAAAADVIQGVPAEAQEMAHQIRTGLREQGKSKAQQDLEYNSILGLLTTARVEAVSEARHILESRGLDTSKTSVQRAAWHILREKIYQMAKNAGLPADEWKAQNHYYRNVIGWNEPETGGKGKLGGPGGFVAAVAGHGKELFTKAGIPAFPFVFGNAMGIALNRKLAYTPLGFFPGFFKGSPWFEGERNIRQRKIEATIGTTIGSTLFTLAALGIVQVLPSFWPKDDKERAKWTANGWQPGMLIVPAGNGQEMKISTRVGPMALLSPYLAAGGALHDANTAQAKKQETLNQQAEKLGLTPQKVGPLDAGQWLNVAGAAAYSSATGGRTASGMLGSYTDFGNFSAKKSGAAATSTLIPGLPGYQELARMAGANINPKLASFWDLLVPLPTSDANRVNLLGDPMRNENDVERVFQILSGGTSPFPTSSDQFKKNKAYANLFASDFRPPSINPTRGYQFGNEIRPMTETELQRYTVARGKNFASELQGVDVNGLAPDEAKKVVQQAFQRANASALESVGATPTSGVGSAGTAATSASGTAATSPATRRASTGSLRASLSRRVRAPAIGRVRSRMGRVNLATMRIPRLKRSRLRASLSRPRTGRFSVRSRMARTRRPQVRYV